MARGVYTVTDHRHGDRAGRGAAGGHSNVRSYNLKAADDILVDMGFPGTAVDEVPSDGWKYSNVHVEVYR